MDNQRKNPLQSRDSGIFDLEKHSGERDNTVPTDKDDGGPIVKEEKRSRGSGVFDLEKNVEERDNTSPTDQKKRGLILHEEKPQDSKSSRCAAHRGSGIFEIVSGTDSESDDSVVSV